MLLNTTLLHVILYFALLTNRRIVIELKQQGQRKSQENRLSVLTSEFIARKLCYNWNNEKYSGRKMSMPLALCAYYWDIYYTL